VLPPCRSVLQAIDRFLDHSTVIPGADDFDILKRERRAALERLKEKRDARKTQLQKEKSKSTISSKTISSKISEALVPTSLRRLLSGPPDGGIDSVLLTGPFFISFVCFILLFTP